MAMRKYVVASILLLPLLLSFSQAAQSWPVEWWEEPFAFYSEDSGTSSYLGVDISDVTTERLSALKLKEEKGVEVTMVDQDAPAGKAGIKEHDVILTMNGTSIESGAQLRSMIHEMAPGRIVSFGLSRDGQPVTVKVQLADKKKEFSMNGHDMKNFHVDGPEIHIPDIDIPAIKMVMVTSSARSGLMVENITPQLGEFFGVKNGNGVLVRSVEKGSRGDKAGFRAGDVIVRVNDQPVHDPSDFSHALRSRNAGAVTVNVIRDRKEQNLNLPLPQRKESGEMEESLELPEIDAETQAELGALQEEMAQLAPQMEPAGKAMQSAKASTRAMCSHKAMRRQREQMNQELKPEIRRQLKNQIERLVYQTREGGLDI